jgi:hypothetical protein
VRAATIWESLPKHKRKYGAGPGTPHPCVKYVVCPYCKAKKGELCSNRHYTYGTERRALMHHTARSSMYTSQWQAGLVPPPGPVPSGSVKRRLHDLERRICKLERLLGTRTR